MSNTVTIQCRPLRVSAAQKAVVMCIADRADDTGTAWPSIPGISEWTCLSRTAVIAAMRELAARGLIEIEKTSGKNNRCTLLLHAIAASCADQSASRTRAADAPVRQTHPTRAADAPPPVREADYTRAADAPEASISITQTPKKQAAMVQSTAKKQKPAKSATSVPEDAFPAWLPLSLWRGFVEMRAARKSPMTVNAQLLLIAKLGRMRENGDDIEQALEDATIGGWTGVYAPKERGGQRARSSVLHADEQFVVVA